ncbi:hypothetical protein D041_0414B, partial [Vibrio parahaemolyticus EKP-008]
SHSKYGLKPSTIGTCTI